MNNKRKGISLIVLVITIIVMIILASAIILALSGSGVIGKSNKAKFQNDIATMREELSVYISNKEAETNGAYNHELLNANKDSLVEEGITVEGKTILDIIKSMDEKYIDKIEIVNGKLKYIGSNTNEIKWSDEILEGIKGNNLEEVKVEQSNTIKLEDSVNTSLANYRIYGNSQQNETPAAIESVGDKSKNLFNIDDYKVGGNPTFEIANGKITATSTWSSHVYYVIENLKPNTTYTLSFFSSYGGVFYIDDASGINKDKYIGADRKNYFNLVSTESGTIKIYFRNSIEVNRNYEVWNIQLEEGNVATDYEPYGKYKIPIVQKGINLFDNANMEVFKNWNATDIKTTDTGVSFVAGDKVGNTTLKLGAISEYNGKTLTLSSPSYNNSAWTQLVIFNGSNVLRQGTTYVSNNNGLYYSTITINDSDCVGGYFLCVRLYYGSETSGNTIEYKDIMIAENSAAIPYEPYVKPATTNIYLDEPLRKIGNYADYIDFRSQEVVRNVEVIDDTGTLPLEQSLSGLDTPIREKITIPSVILNEGTNIIEVLTKVQPSKIETLYYKK